MIAEQGTRPVDSLGFLGRSVKPLGIPALNRERPGSGRSQIRTLYRQAASGLVPFADEYSKANVQEFFAQATKIWFGAHPGVGGSPRDAAWIRANHPALARALRAVYGPPRNIYP